MTTVRILVVFKIKDFCGDMWGVPPPMTPWARARAAPQHQQADWSDGFAVVFLIISNLIVVSPFD